MKIRVCAQLFLMTILASPGLCFAENNSAATPEPATKIIRPGETLTLAQVVSIARQQQPSLRAAQSSINAQQSKVGQAQAGYYPQIDANASYNRWSPAGTTFSQVNSTSHDQYNAALQIKQMLYDFGKTTSQVDIQKTSLDSSFSDLKTTEEQVIFNVKLSYYEMLKAAKNIEIATETVKQFEEHLNQAKGFFVAGLKPKYDVTKAEVDLSNAKLNLIQKNNSLRLSRVVLNNAMGLPEAPDYQIVDNLQFSPFQLPFEQALLLAFDNRPDLKSLLLKKRAAEQSVALARKGDLPYLTGNANTSYTGESFGLDQGWSIGVALSIPVFNGYQTKYQVSEAQANLDLLSANETSLRQTIYKDVQQGYLNLQNAAERISNTQLAIQQAEENSALASGRYEAGVGAPIEVTDADTLLVNAKTTHIQALYDYRITQTIIEQTIGNAYGDEK
ncbi:MAG: TolC family protein [Desulfobulbaceae bacterium]|nr:TolC family protein [Desulfobulbaceae bacterium]